MRTSDWDGVYRPVVTRTSRNTTAGREDELSMRYIRLMYLENEDSCVDYEKKND